MSVPPLVDTPAALAEVVARASRAPALALDIEGNGLHAYRSRLCTVQLAWTEDGAAHACAIDAILLDPRPLAPLMGPDGPPKILHDLTFDARMLAEAGIALGNVRDTSVLARFLGRTATGLSSLLQSELGVTIDKAFQQHDWARRPLRPEEVEYLLGDVRSLEALERKLAAEAAERGIADEVAEEVLYKLATGLAPPADRGPAYLRVKGAEKLPPLALATLRHLVEAREAVAEQWDVPPFKVVGNDVLLDLATRRPRSPREIAGARGMSHRARSIAARLADAIARGIEDGAPPDAPAAREPRPARAEAQALKKREARLTAFRRSEARARGVDEQVVLPGHCLHDLADANPVDRDGLARVPGLGACRVARYEAALLGALREPAPTVTAPEA